MQLDIYEFDELHKQEPKYNSASALKNVYLKKSMLAFILGIEEFQEKPQSTARKQSYTEQPTEKETAQAREIETLKQQLQAKDDRIDELKKHIATTTTKDTEEITKAVEKYNVRERQTHLTIIKGLLFARTDKDFSAQAFFKNNGGLKISSISSQLAHGLQELGNDASDETIRKALTKILKEPD